MDYSWLSKEIQRLEKEAAEQIRSAGRITAECKNSARDVVTEVDKNVQLQLMAGLKELVPGAEFFCEELGAQCRADDASVFIIDPIDGTMNFLRGFNHSCISVAYAENGEIKVGVIYNPYVDEMFHAVKGQGTFLNDRRLSAGDRTLSDSVVCVGTSPYYPEYWDKSFELFRKVFDAGLDIRRQGSAALDLCSAAAGRAGLYFELKLSLWDFAAGKLLVEEAGGVVCNIEGEPIVIDGRKSSVVAGTRKAVLEFLKMV